MVIKTINEKNRKLVLSPYNKGLLHEDTLYLNNFFLDLL